MKEEKEKRLYDFIAELLNQDNVIGATLIMPDCPVMQFIKLDRQKKKKGSTSHDRRTQRKD